MDPWTSCLAPTLSVPRNSIVYSPELKQISFPVTLLKLQLTQIPRLAPSKSQQTHSLQAKKILLSVEPRLFSAPGTLNTDRMTLACPASCSGVPLMLWMELSIPTLSFCLSGHSTPEVQPPQFQWGDLCRAEMRIWPWFFIAF